MAAEAMARRGDGRDRQGLPAADHARELGIVDPEGFQARTFW